MSFWTSFSSKRRPMRRLTAKTDGVVRAPSEFSITLGWPPSMIATQLFVVPRSMPMILLIAVCLRAADGFDWTWKWGWRGLESIPGGTSGRLGNGNQRRAQDPVVQQVPFLEHRHHRV